MKKQLHYCWVILISTCIMMAVGFGMCLNSVGVFFPVVAQSLGVTNTHVSFYMTIQCLSLTLGMYTVGRIISNVSIKLLLSIGGIAISLCFLFLSFGTKVWHWYFVAVPLGFFSGFIAPVPIGILISNWFEKKRGLASGVAYAFSGIMGAILSPIASSIIEAYGWRVAYRVYSLIPIALLLPVAIFLIEFTPEKKGFLPYGVRIADSSERNEATDTTVPLTGVSFSAVKKMAVFYIAILSAGIISVANGFSQQFPNYALSRQFNAQTGSFMVTTCMVMQLITNVPLGILCDRIGIAKAATIYSSIGLMGAIILALAKTQMLAFVGCAMYGLGACQTMVIPPQIALEIFGSRDYPRINSIIMMGTAFFGAFSSTLYSGVAEKMHSYTLSLLLAALLSLIAIVFINIIMRHKIEE